MIKSPDAISMAAVFVLKNDARLGDGKVQTVSDERILE